MNEVKKIYYTASEVSKLLGVSIATSYRIIKKLNSELEEQGYIVIAGKLPIKYFEQRYFGLNA